MKHITVALMLICSIAVMGQSSKEHYQNGISKHEKQDFKGAIKDYTKAIKADKTNKDAYFNRGTCELALNHLDAAMRDYDQTIKLDPNFARAYYSRASIYVSQQKYVESLPDLDKTIELDPSTRNALTLRGQIRASTGNTKGACEDFNTAKEIGDKEADRYLNKFCTSEPQTAESLALDWPKEENWRLDNSQEDEQMTMLEFVHSNESIENWTELGTMMSVKGVKNVPMDVAMNMMYDEAQKNSPKATLTFIEKDESVEYPWIIFTIEAPSFNNDKTPESQLWYIVQGKTALYTNFRAIKQATVPSELKEKWIKFFKTAKVVSQ